MSSPKTAKNRSNAPAGTEETNASGNTESNAAAVIIDAGATPPGSSVPGGTNTESADGKAAAHDQAGETASVSPADLAAALELTGSSDFAHLVEMAAQSTAIAEAVAAHTAGALQDWAPAEDPIQFMDDLVAEILLLRSQVAERVAADATVMAEGSSVSAGAPSPEFGDRYPLTASALSAFEAAHGRGRSPLVRITSARDGFRRAGLVHSITQREYPLADLSPEQVETFLGEPVLTVELV
nr:hypothetical protein [uncultured Shinella sp.]